MESLSLWQVFADLPGSQSVLTECSLCQHSVYRELVNMPQCQQVDSPRATAGELVSCCCAPRAGCRQEKPLRTRTILATLHLHYTCYLATRYAWCRYLLYSLIVRVKSVHLSKQISNPNAMNIQFNTFSVVSIFKFSLEIIHIEKSLKNKYEKIFPFLFWMFYCWLWERAHIRLLLTEAAFCNQWFWSTWLDDG